MYSKEHYRQVRIFVTMPAVREVLPSAAIELFLRFGQVRKICLDRDQGMARLPRSREELKEVDAVERLRDFIRLNYMTAAEVARQIGVRDKSCLAFYFTC
jgi:hypothetical protein